MRKFLFVCICTLCVTKLVFSQGKLKIEGNYPLQLYGQSETRRFTFSVLSNMVESQEVASDSIDLYGNFSATLNIDKPQPVFWVLPTSDKRSEIPIRTFWLGKGNLKMSIYFVYDLYTGYTSSFDNPTYHIYTEGDYETENKFLEKLYRADYRFINIFSTDATTRMRTSPEKYFYSVDSAYIVIKQEYDKIKNLKLSPGFHEFAQAEIENFVYAHKLSFLLLKSSYELYNKSEGNQEDTSEKMGVEKADKYIGMLSEKLIAQPMSALTLSPYHRSAWLSYLYYEWIKKITDNGQLTLGDFNSSHVKAFNDLIKEKFAQKPAYYESLTALILSEGLMTILRTEGNISVFREWLDNFHATFPKSAFYPALQKKSEKRIEKILQQNTTDYAVDTMAVDTAMIDPTGSLEEDITATLYETDKKAPSYGLSDAKGKNINLADLKGNVVCVFLWNQYSEPIIRQMAYSKWLTEGYKGEPVKFLVLDSSPKSDLTGVLKTLKLKLPVINIKSNQDGEKFKNDYADIYTYGYYFLIDKSGTVWQYNYGEDIKKAIDYLLEK